MAVVSAASPHPPPAPAPGILLVNSGTPQSPTTAALRNYHAEFLSDPRVIDWPRWLWLPLLHLIILRSRPRKVAQKYQEIWTEHGSPLLNTTQEAGSKLEALLQEQIGLPAHVTIGMRYGQPSIREGLRALRTKGASRIILLPLFPQYSKVTTASAYDAASEELATWRHAPEVRTIDKYYDHPSYIRAIKESILEFWDEHGEPDRLLFSYHGIPMSYANKGDPYGGHCMETTQLVMRQICSPNVEIQTAFQSRFGPHEWLMPYTDELLRSWARDGAKRVHVLCPGFAADCLETLHEIGIEAREDFCRSSGGEFRYIPALNARPAHIRALADILKPHLADPAYRETSQLANELGA
jgi:protoporphyrin/coproporphyrin ferrochelatase